MHKKITFFYVFCFCAFFCFKAFAFGETKPTHITEIDPTATRRTTELEKALNLYETAQYNKAYKALTPLAKDGIITAQYMLGMINYKGAGRRNNFKQAIYWFYKASKQGHPGAQYNLAMMYLKGQGVQQDLQKAHMWASVSSINNKDEGIESLKSYLESKLTESQFAKSNEFYKSWEQKYYWNMHNPGGSLYSTGRKSNRFLNETQKEYWRNTKK